MDLDRLVARVPSRSRPAVVYTIRLDAAGGYSCTCPGYQFRRRCRHVVALAALRALPVAQ